MTNAEKLRAFRQQHPGYDRDRARTAKTNRRVYVINYFGGKCVRCGYDKCLAAMTFHHRPGETKCFTVSHREMRRHSMEEIIDECSKCDLLCLNCHAETHHDHLMLADLTKIATTPKITRRRSKRVVTDEVPPG